MVGNYPIYAITVDAFLGYSKLDLGVLSWPITGSLRTKRLPLLLLKQKPTFALLPGFR
jgi:hypothetical protein